jgi:hypothetical protein
MTVCNARSDRIGSPQDLPIAAAETHPDMPQSGLDVNLMTCATWAERAQSRSGPRIVSSWDSACESRSKSCRE